MAQASRANRAILFMRLCRHRGTSLPPVQKRHTSHTSPYDPSNFAKPLRRDPSTPDPFDLPAKPDHAHPTARPPQPTETVYPGVRQNAWNSLRMAFGWRPKAPANYNPAPFNIRNNPYQARKKWPPDFSTMHPKQQFHYEKTYRRRAKLAYARPRWNRRVKTLQHTGIILTVLYFVFICEPEDKMGTPFDGFRAWFFSKLKNLGTLPESTRHEAARLEQEARETMKSRRSLLSGPKPEQEESTDG